MAISKDEQEENVQPGKDRYLRVIGGTETGRRTLAQAGHELTRRQQNPVEGDEAERERWDEALVLYVEDVNGFGPRSMAHIERLAREGRQQGIVVSISRRHELPADHGAQLSAKQRLGLPNLDITLEEASAMVGKAMADIEERSKIARGSK